MRRPAPAQWRAVERIAIGRSEGLSGITADGHSHSVVVDGGAMAQLKASGFARVRSELGGPQPHRHAILVSMCRRCHNATRNPALSRARFDVDRLDDLPATELERVRARIKSPPSSASHMPPPRFGQLTAAEVARVELSLDLIVTSKDNARE